MDPIGLDRTLPGLMPTQIPGLERLYMDRVILMPTSQCFAYCRFCFRKNYSHKATDGDYGTPQQHFAKAIKYIANDPRIKEVLITGGDPLMFPEKVLEIIDKLRTIPHLIGIRIGSRIFTSDPDLIDEKWIQPFKERNQLSNDQMIQFSESCRSDSKIRKFENSSIPAPVSISPHINHTDEITVQAAKSLLLCTQNNIPLYNQTVLMKGINNNPEVLLDLFRKLRQLGVEPYRVYHADPLQGTEHFRTTLDEFMTIKRYLRAHGSGRIVPSFIVDTRVGKVELGADADILRRVNETVTIKTPYTLDQFRAVIPDWEIPEYCSLAEDGRLIVEYEDAYS
ncbi:MAG: radical SAM protein [Candidatus Gracilibacteria bacterium]|nr:radical SAM protein [Candidatus Gracilibacteria bacterium]